MANIEIRIFLMIFRFLIISVCTYALQLEFFSIATRVIVFLTMALNPKLNEFVIRGTVE